MKKKIMRPPINIFFVEIFMKTTEMYLGIKKETPQKIEVGWMLNTGKANNVKICIDATRTYNNTKNAIEKC